MKNTVYFYETAMKWLEYVKVNIKASSYSNYYYLVHKHILPLLGKVEMKKLSKSKLDNFIKEKMTNGKLKQPGGVSKKYLQDMITIIKAIASYCEDTTGIKNRLHNSKRIKVSTKKPSVISKHEKKTIIEHISQERKLIGLGVILALYTGMRIGEVCGLRWSDYNKYEGYIKINRTVQRISDNKGGTFLLIGTPKTQSSERIIPIPNELKVVLDRLNPDDDKPMISEDYSYVEPNKLRRYFYGVSGAAINRHIKFHELRHSFATECIQLQFDIKALSELLGHSNASITLNKYVHTDLNVKKSYMERITY